MGHRGAGQGAEDEGFAAHGLVRPFTRVVRRAAQHVGHAGAPEGEHHVLRAPTEWSQIVEGPLAQTVGVHPLGERAGVELGDGSRLLRHDAPA